MEAGERGGRGSQGDWMGSVSMEVSVGYSGRGWRKAGLGGRKVNDGSVWRVFEAGAKGIDLL